MRLSNGHSGRPEYTESDVLKDVRQGRIVLVDKLGGFPAFPMFEYRDGQWRSTEDFRTDFFLRSALEYLNRQELTPDDIKMGAAQGGATFAGITSTAVNDDVAVDTTNATPDRKPSLPLGESAKVAPLATAPAAQTAAINEPDKIEPGFHVVRQPMSLDELKHELYGSNSAVPNRFNELNPNLKGVVLPGQMIVLGDPNGSECTLEEAQLMDVADQVNREVDELSEEEAGVLVEHYDLLKFMASSGSAGLGAGSFVIKQQINAIETSLRELETLHQQTYSRFGNLNQASFFEERRAIFKKLDFNLGHFARKGMSIDPDSNLKRALGLSSKSIVHHWKQAGVGDIPGYRVAARGQVLRFAPVRFWPIQKQKARPDPATLRRRAW
ncbi:hypothetical protein [Marinobacter sp. NFXS9]|uniref:hypothetical protein n=1 Tax=Marinobacter sp. NFXS9 TaxID=2818433 RepID=UPI0032E00BA7